MIFYLNKTKVYVGFLLQLSKGDIFMSLNLFKEIEIKMGVSYIPSRIYSYKTEANFKYKYRSILHS